MSAAIKPVKAEDSDAVMNSNGMTPLMNAVCDDAIDHVRTLLDSGVDINAKRDDGFTALTLAAFFGRTEIVEVLLQRGADTEAKTRFGTSALMWATARGFPKIVNLLVKAAKKPVAERTVYAEQKTHRQTKPMATKAKILPEPIDPLPVVVEAFHPGQVFVARIISSPKNLAALAAVIIAVLGSGMYGIYRVTRTSDNTSQLSTPVNEMTVETKAPVVQAAPQQSEPQEVKEPPESPVYSNHTVKPSIKTFSPPTASRWSASRREHTAARDVEVQQHDAAESESKPAPLTVEVSRQRRNDPAPASTNADETPRTQPAPLGITSGKPQTKVIQWP